MVHAGERTEPHLRWRRGEREADREGKRERNRFARTVEEVALDKAAISPVLKKSVSTKCVKTPLIEHHAYLCCWCTKAATYHAKLVDVRENLRIGGGPAGVHYQHRKRIFPVLCFFTLPITGLNYTLAFFSCICSGRRSTSWAGNRAASRGLPGKQRDSRRIRSVSANYARNGSKNESRGSGSSEQDAQLVPSGGASSSVKSVFGYDPQKGLIKLADIFDAVVRPGDDSASPEDEDEDVAPPYFAAQEEHHEDPPYASAAASRPGTPGSYGFYSGASEFGAASSSPAGAAYTDFVQHQQDQEAGAAGNDVYIDIEVLEVALEDSHPETVQRAL